MVRQFSCLFLNLSVYMLFGAENRKEIIMCLTQNDDKGGNTAFTASVQLCRNIDIRLNPAMARW